LNVLRSPSGVKTREGKERPKETGTSGKKVQGTSRLPKEGAKYEGRNDYTRW